MGTYKHLTKKSIFLMYSKLILKLKKKTVDD